MEEERYKDCLKSKDEVVEFLKAHGGNYEALSDIVEAYHEACGEELCWHYPITDELHTGTYILRVKEGALALPYNLVDENDFEVFCVDEIKLLDAASMDILIDEWSSYSYELLKAMCEIRKLLAEQEKRR